MSTVLEKIIRPGQTGDIRPSYFVVQRKEPKTPNDNLITWGSPGESVFQLSAHLQQQVKNTLDSDETKRKYDVVEIHNPDDEEQKVTVEALTEYQARNQIDKARIKLRYAAQQESDTIKIVSRGKIRKTGSGE